MDGGEGGMAGSREEHPIFIPDDDNAGGSGASVGPRIITEEENVSSLPSDPPNEDEEWIQYWITEVRRKIFWAVNDSTSWPLYFKDEPEDNICKSTLRESISRPKLQTIEELSQPSVVEIGPLQRLSRPECKEVTIFYYAKWRILFLMKLLCGLDLVRCLVKIKNQVENARSRYKLDELKRHGFEDEDRFKEMLLLDSFFILFTLTIKLRKGLAGYTLIPTTPNPARPMLLLFQDDHFKFLDIMFNKEELVTDLLILDNQIPFLVIEELFTELKSEKPLHEYALEFFETIHPRSARRSIDQHSPPKFLHLLDLFHWSRVPQNKYILSKQPDSIYWAPHTPNAMELRESATAFEKKTSGSSLDITFRRRLFNRIIGVLDIPEVHIRDYSGLIFHNLIAFEIQSSRRGRCTVAFSALMRNFLQREEDVKLLRQRGILASSSMTDRQLIDLFARLSKLTEYHQMPGDLCAICDQVQSHHNHPVSQFCGSVILQYFPNPLVTLSVFGATMLFILTLLQTIYTMISYYHS